MKQITNKDYEILVQYKKSEQQGRILTPNSLRLICETYDNDPEKIGRHFLEILNKFEGINSKKL